MKEKVEINVGELRRSGIVKLKEQDMFSLWIKTACCNLNSNQLRMLANIIDKYARGYLLFTTRQIPIIPFVKLKDLEAVKGEMAKVDLELDRCGPTVRNINVCYDDKICPDAVTNSIALAEKLENFFSVPMLHKVKIGVAGCKKDTIICRVLNDIGFVGTENENGKGYDAYVGGRLGLNPFVGVKMAACLSEEECVKLVENFFDFLTKEGKKEERIADLIDRLGVEKVKQALTKELGQGSSIKSVPCETRLEESQTDKVILRVRATCGEITSRQLRQIAGIAERYGRGFVHFGVRGAPEIPCVDKSELGDIGKELKEVGMEIMLTGIDNLQTCFGNYCTESNADPQSLLRRIEKKVEALQLDNQAIKISASGCPNSCGIAHLNDIGFYGVVDPVIDKTKCNGCELCVPVCKRKAITMAGGVAVIDEERCRHCGQCIVICPFDAIGQGRKGFAVLVGGREGENTRLGEIIAEFVSEDEAVAIAERCLRLMKEKDASVATIIGEMGSKKLADILVAGKK